MSDTKTTTIRFSEHVYQSLEKTSELTGLPINSLVVQSCIEYLQHHYPEFWTGSRPEAQSLKDSIREQVMRAMLDNDGRTPGGSSHDS